jgi:hypothetical protein
MEVLPDLMGQEESVLKPWVDPHQLKQHQGRWYKDGRQVVTGGMEAKRYIIQSHHNSPVHRHPGISKTVQLTERLYWWPKMRQDIMEYVKGCAECQRHKVNNRPTKAPLQPIYPKAEAMPFETVALDFIVKLPISQGFDSILTITDQGCTKAAIFIPCNEDITAEETAALYIKHVFTHFGLPTKVISDRDPRFMSKFMQEACKVTGVKHAPSMAYHPRTDRQSERSNQWLETAICFITDQKQKNWAPYLPITQFAHNNWPSDMTRKSPFFLLMGFNPRADWVHATSPIPRVTLRLEQIKEARVQAQEAMTKAQQSWVKHCDMPKYKEGDLVWLEGKNLRINQPTAKLAPRQHGPFKIIQVMSTVNYHLELPTQWSIHPVFHIDLLTPYKETIMHGPNFTRPAPELIDGEEEYSMEKILDSQHFGRRRRLQYLVKWEGYPDAENMWVDKDDVFADDKVREFKASNPDSATHIRSTSVAKSPHPPTSALSHLLHQHALTYMSSDGNNDLAHEYTAGAVADSPIPFSQTNPVDTPVIVPVPIVDFVTLQPLDPAATIFSPRPVTASSSASDVAAMFRQLRVHTPAPLTPDGQRVADQSNKTFAILFTPAERRGGQASAGVELGTATRPEAAVGTTMTTTHRSRSSSYDSDAVLTVGSNKNTATVTPLLSRTPPSTSHLTPLESHCQDLFCPMVWRDLTSVVQRPRRWQLASPPVSGKTTKMPLWFRQSATTGKSLRGSSPRVLVSLPPPLPKGWVYAAEEVSKEVKAEVIDPSLYQITSAPLTCSRLNHAKSLADPHCRHRRALSITEDRHSSPSVSVLTPAVKHRRVTSGPISTLLTLCRGASLT